MNIHSDPLSNSQHPGKNGRDRARSGNPQEFSAADEIDWTWEDLDLAADPLNELLGPAGSQLT